MASWLSLWKWRVFRRCRRNWSSLTCKPPRSLTPGPSHGVPSAPTPSSWWRPPSRASARSGPFQTANSYRRFAATSLKWDASSFIRRYSLHLVLRPPCVRGVKVAKDRVVAKNGQPHPSIFLLTSLDRSTELFDFFISWNFSTCYYRKSWPWSLITLQGPWSWWCRSFIQLWSLRTCRYFGHRQLRLWTICRWKRWTLQGRRKKIQ